MQLTYNKLPLAPLSAFTAFAVLVLLPLSHVGSVYCWPCPRLAFSLCWFTLGVIFAERRSPQWSQRKMSLLALLAALFYLIKVLWDAHVDYIYYERFWSRLMPLDTTLVLLFFYIAFAIAGALTHLQLKSRPNSNTLCRDVVSGCAALVVYMLASLLPRIWTGMPLPLETLLDALNFLPWLATLYFVYRAASSKAVLCFAESQRKLVGAIATLFPIAMLLMILNIL